MAFDCTRRHFFFGPLLAAAVPAAGFGSAASLRSMGHKSPNEKLNIAAIGAGGKASSDIDGWAMENIVALCDVDKNQGARRFNENEKVPKTKDFRTIPREQGLVIEWVVLTRYD